MNANNAVKEALQKSVDAGDLAGAATLAWRNGNVQTGCAGWRDRETNLPVERDTIFRLASMTKPVTSLAALMLVEQGRFALTDPISRYAPEFSEMRVLRSPEGPLDDTVAVERQITFEDLLTHRAGLTYADFHKGPITPAYRKALGGEIDSHVVPDEWIAELAKLPLIAQPGSGMYYSRATDLVGLLIARAEGMPLGAVLKRLVFDPLGMKDTGFLVPRENRHRRASAYGFDDAGRLVKLPEWGVVVAERPDDMAYESGGTGLWSTVDDYLKFARLFVSGGEVDGVRLLRPETLAMMTSNWLTDSQRANYTLLGQKPFAVGRGFGLGVSVVLETDKADMMRRGNPGTVSWPGAWGAWWQADPKSGSVLIFLATSVARMDQMSKGIGLGVWMAISEFQRLAS
jgi:CubicO group peptidase (beta-lactamase class C family)